MTLRELREQLRQGPPAWPPPCWTGRWYWRAAINGN